MRAAALGVLSLGFVGCAATEPLADIDSTRDWANRSSAVGIWSRVHDIVAAGAGRDPFRDPECPVISVDGDTTTVTGGCVANDGRTWAGSATVVTSGEDQDVTITDFGNAEDPGLMSKLSGTATIRGLADGSHSFDLDLVSDTPFQGLYTITYAGTVVGDYTGPSTWNGSGTIDLDGTTVTVSTVDELWDGAVCNGAPASGRTTMSTDLHTVVITYDGATDCDDDKNAQWTQDGVSQGAIDGITCAVRPGGGRAALPLLGLGLVVALAVRRRRRS